MQSFCSRSRTVEKEKARKTGHLTGSQCQATVVRLNLKVGQLTILKQDVSESTLWPASKT